MAATALTRVKVSSMGEVVKSDVPEVVDADGNMLSKEALEELTNGLEEGEGNDND